MEVGKIAPKSKLIQQAVELEKKYQILDKSFNIKEWMTKQYGFFNKFSDTGIHEINYCTFYNDVIKYCDTLKLEASDILRSMTDEEICDYLETKGYSHRAQVDINYYIDLGA